MGEGVINHEISLQNSIDEIALLTKEQIKAEFYEVRRPNETEIAAFRDLTVQRMKAQGILSAQDEAVGASSAAGKVQAEVQKFSETVELRSNLSKSADELDVCFIKGFVTALDGVNVLLADAQFNLNDKELEKVKAMIGGIFQERDNAIAIARAEREREYQKGLEEWRERQRAEERKPKQ